ncbi:hypothetical protein FIBSPDRAFT_901876 [Athelia psychrophila]|uniref:Uncharacterized protein n=1 Tax=Athelia psychrophila TaxID=1759441 RepID=A0A165WJI0_9AGAM|nr:hypothetical protein FIBSPDRAFT_901876 [Fibularhizoctonia sp. CBS 109695]
MSTILPTARPNPNTHTFCVSTHYQLSHPSPAQDDYDDYDDEPEDLAHALIASSLQKTQSLIPHRPSALKARHCALGARDDRLERPIAPHQPGGAHRRALPAGGVRAGPSEHRALCGKVELSGSSLGQVVHPRAAAEFVNAGQGTRSKRMVHSCSGYLVDVPVDVDLQGTRPWKLVGKWWTRKAREALQIPGCKTPRAQLEVPIPREVNQEGGSFDIELSE